MGYSFLVDAQDLIQRLALIYRRADDACARIREEYPGLVPCRPGCTDCCHAVFDVSIIEGLFIARTFSRLDRHTRRDALRRAKRALNAWTRLMRSGTDLSRERIRCPLLSDRGLCICYVARPINCRTYGVPTAFQGEGHVCGLTGFRHGQRYTTLELDPLHKALFDLSREAVPSMAYARLPIARVIESARELSRLFPR